MTNRLSKMHQRVNQTPLERAKSDLQSEKDKAADILKNHDIPPNSYWDEANRAHREIHDAVTLANLQLSERVQFAMMPENRPKIKDEAALASNLNLVTKDILKVREQIDMIQPRHAGKVGMASTPEDLIEVMEINDLYRAALSLYNSNVMPVVAHIFELLNLDSAEAQQALDQQAVMADNMESIVIKHDDATDPNVVTDVVVKTPTVVSDVDNKTSEG